MPAVLLVTPVSINTVRVYPRPRHPILSLTFLSLHAVLATDSYKRGATTQTKWAGPVFCPKSNAALRHWPLTIFFLIKILLHCLFVIWVLLSCIDVLVAIKSNCWDIVTSGWVKTAKTDCVLRMSGRVLAHCNIESSCRSLNSMLILAFTFLYAPTALPVWKSPYVKLTRQGRVTPASIFPMYPIKHRPHSVKHIFQFFPLDVTLS